MAGIRVVTDSAADLPASLAAQHDIRIVPLDVRLGKWGPEEMRLIDPAEFWRRCAMTDALPETSAPSPGAFAENFTQAADDGCSGVVCLTLSSQLSSTYQAACAGADEVSERVEVRVIDTRTVTLGQGMIVLEAAQVAAATGDLGDAEAAARAVVPRIRVFGALDTMDNVRKGGRIGTARALLGSILSIKPIVEIRDGVAVAESRQRTRGGSLEYLANKLRNAGELEGLAVVHAAAPDLDTFLGMIEDVYPRDEILVNYLGPVIGTHAGPRCIGICYRLAQTAAR
ncbi:MAG: DegV family protein [Acidimicrobiales bacterium]|jgi:DegV family protein with EDD domain